MMKYLVENKANLCKLFSIMRDSANPVQQSIYDGTIRTVRKTDFISTLICPLKERKSSKDRISIKTISFFSFLTYMVDEN